MTPRQQQRIELLKQFSDVDIVRFRENAKNLGMPNRFIKALDEMKAYAEHSQMELKLQTSKEAKHQV